MKKTFLFILSLFAVFNVFAQKTELKIALNSGLFSFSGASAESHTFINYSDLDNRGYTNNPYGSENGLTYGLSANIQRVTKHHFIVGFDFGYEQLKSKTSIIGIAGYTGNSTYSYQASGSTSLKFDFLNLNPYIGYRAGIKNVSLDLTGGLEIGQCLSSGESGKAEDENGKKYMTSLDRTTIKMDLRPRVQLAAAYKKAGVYVGYSYGLKNYKEGYIGGVNECSSRIIRFGITYRIF
jgi:hypothetical protein